MSVLGVRVIESSNLSFAWGEALIASAASTATTLAPYVISIADFPDELPAEHPSIRAETDAFLAEREDLNPIRITAMTIFPWELWQHRGRPACADFSKLCVEKLSPRMKARDRRNQNGIYFERMMAYEGLKAHRPRTVDQVEFVINLLKHDRMPRRSALQIACFDPAKDHTGQPVRGFPCLQQVSVSHDGADQLAINAYYPTQYMFDRAYGNYLGLCHLGAFIAHQTSMRFVRLNCFIGRPELGKIGKRAVAPLLAVIRAATTAVSTAENLS